MIFGLIELVNWSENPGSDVYILSLLLVKLKRLDFKPAALSLLVIRSLFKNFKNTFSLEFCLKFSSYLSHNETNKQSYTLSF